MKNYIAMLVVSLSLMACTSATKPDTSKPAAPQEAVQPSKPEVAKMSSAEVAAAELAQQLQQLKQDNVYFDFDKSLVKPEFRDVIAKQADFIKAHKNDTVTLEGNCDERGSAEYNLALGNRRAHVVSHELQLLGIPKQQIKTVSYGNERPRSICHDESCWKDNRRVDFVHHLN